MENITLEQIDLIMQRANVSFTDAKAALEQTNGNILDALLLLEQGGKIKDKEAASKSGDAGTKFKNFMQKLHKTRFIMKKKETTYVNIPLSIALLGILLSFHFAIVALVISLVCGIKIEFEGNTDIAEKINSTVQNLQ